MDVSKSKKNTQVVNSEYYQSWSDSPRTNPYHESGEEGTTSSFEGVSNGRAWLDARKNGTILINPMVRARFNVLYGGHYKNQLKPEYNGVTNWRKDEIPDRAGLFFANRGSMPAVATYSETALTLSERARSDACAAAIAGIKDNPLSLIEDALEIRQSFALAQSILRDTHLIMRDGLPKLLEAYKQMSKRKRTKAILSLLFSIDFGILPLYRSAMGIMDLFSNNPDLLRPKTYKSSRQSVHTATATGPWTAASGLAGTSSGSLKVTAKSVIFFKADTTDPLTLANALGLEPHNLFVGAWKVTRLSFMVDRIINITTFLQGLTSMGQLASGEFTVTGAYITTVLEGLSTVTATRLEPAMTTTTVELDAFVQSDWTNIARVLWEPSLSDVGAPIDVSNLLYFNGEYSPQKTAELLGIMLQLTL